MDRLAQSQDAIRRFRHRGLVARNGTFFRELQRRGAELAVHGYHHLDFRALSTDESRRQFAVATDAYRRNGIQFGGFRCPYLSYTQRLNGALPNGDFQVQQQQSDLVGCRRARIQS